MKNSTRLSLWGLFWIIIAIVVIFEKGIATTAVFALALVCVYFNTVIVISSLAMLRGNRAQSVLIVATVLISNLVLMHFTGFSLMVALLVWLPALSMKISIKIFR